MNGDDWQRQNDNNFTDARLFAGRMSDTAKYVWLGAFGLLFAARTAAAGSAHSFYARNQWLLFAAACLGAVAFLADLVKNYAGFRFALRLNAWISNSLAADPEMTGVMGRPAAYDALIAAAFAPRLSKICLTASVGSAVLAALFIAIAFIPRQA